MDNREGQPASARAPAKIAPFASHSASLASTPSTALVSGTVEQSLSETEAPKGETLFGPATTEAEAGDDGRRGDGVAFRHAE